MIGWLDNLIHHPRMAWLPRPLTSWVCDLQDHRLGMTWAQIRRARHGKLSGYTNQLDWRAITSASSATKHDPGRSRRPLQVGGASMIRWARYRKTLAAVGLGLVELAAYVAADPRDLPSWVVTGALAVNALAVFYVRNAPPPQMAPTLFARRPVRDDPPPQP